MKNKKEKINLLNLSHLLDPYARTAMGIAAGSLLFLSENEFVRYAGIGFAIVSALQILEVFKGGCLISNKATKQIFVLHKTKGVIELKTNEIPDYNICGITYKGLNGVYKLADGVYAKINSKNEINATGLGKVVNRLHKSGFKNKLWIDKQTDERWSKLYEKSI